MRLVHAVSRERERGTPVCSEGVRQSLHVSEKTAIVARIRELPNSESLSRTLNHFLYIRHTLCDRGYSDT